MYGNMRRIDIILTAVAALAVAASCNDSTVPAPYAPVPTEAQVQWQRMEYYMFVHFGPNTFTDSEWGTGEEGAVGPHRPGGRDEGHHPHGEAP